MTNTIAPHLSRFELKGTEKRQFTGLASTWDLDEGGDLILQGAFSRSLGEIKASSRKVPLINQHSYWDARDAIGKMVSASETKEGLEATFQVVASKDGDEFLARIREGIIDGLSIGYETRGWREPSESEKKRGVFRVLTDVELREVSLVIWGMNSGAVIDTSSVKSIRSIRRRLSRLKPEQLTDEHKKLLRQSASQIGVLLKTDAPPPADKAAAASDDESTPKPDATPGPAATQKAPVLSDDAQAALKNELLTFQMKQTINAA